jgi:hypothetical protein
MRVRAVESGYFDMKRRKVGEEFEIGSVAEFGSWMEAVSEKDKGLVEKEMARRAELKRKQKTNRDAVELAHRAIVKSAAESLQSDVL